MALITAGGDPNNDELSGTMRPTPWLEQCPYLMQSLEALGAKLEMEPATARRLRCSVQKEY